MSLTDEDITTEWRAAAPRVLASGPTEEQDDKDAGGSGDADTGDESGGDADTTDSTDADTVDH